MLGSLEIMLPSLFNGISSNSLTESESGERLRAQFTPHASVFPANSFKQALILVQDCSVLSRLRVNGMRVADALQLHGNGINVYISQWLNQLSNVTAPAVPFSSFGWTALQEIT